jgi:dolichyl-diphosphooligosaccharide--protein glycosyltransferase
MSDVREAVKSLLADHPEIESELWALLELDENPPWEFDDTPLDSGQFGEIVSRGIAEQYDDGYRITDPSAVEAVLDGSETDTEPATTTTVSRLGTYGKPIVEWYRNNPFTLACLMGVLALVAVLRVAFVYPGVFRERQTLLTGNDSYMYLYWVEQLLTGSHEAFHIGSLSQLPPWLASHDVLPVVILWWIATIAGGTVEVVRTILVWYPVVASVIVGGVLYLCAVSLTSDRRVGIATVGMFAVTPAAATRTMLGFADTEGFDFIWLGVTLLALFVLARSDEPDSWMYPDRSTLIATVALTLGISGQLYTWRGAPLYLAAIALFVAAFTFSGLRSNRPVSPVLVPIMAASVFSTGLLAIAYFGFNWFQGYRLVTPPLLFGGTAAMFAFAVVVKRRDPDLRLATGGFAVLGAVALAVGWQFVPAISAGIIEFVNYMQRFTWTNIGETQSLFAGGLGSVAGPLLKLGFVSLLGIGGLLVATWLSYSQHRPGWLLATIYAWHFLLLSVVQIRFAGPYGMINAILAGAAFVQLAAAVELVDPVAWTRPVAETTRDVVSVSVPDRRTAVFVCVLFFAVASLGLIQIPIQQHTLTISEDRYQAAVYIDDYSAEHDQSYPDNYVLSEWSWNRMYNYVISGESHLYEFAEENYLQFLRSEDPSGQYTHLENRTGYVVLSDWETDAFSAASMQTRLFQHHGSMTNETPALEQYRTIYTGQRHVVELVPGATVTGTDTATEAFVVSTTVTTPPNGTQLTYEQRVRTDSEGQFEFTTPYPGTYDLPNGSVTVPDSAVENGDTVQWSRSE